jgi:hypothetical protein
VKDHGGLKERVHLASDADLPNVVFNEMDEDTATLAAGSEELTIEADEEETIELDSQTVEIEIPSDEVTEEEFEPDDYEEFPDGEAPETVTYRKTGTKKVTVTPFVRVTHHGQGNKYGVKNGVALPYDDSHPMSRRAQRVSEIPSDVVSGLSDIGGSDEKKIIIIQRERGVN